jgi:DNA-binding response OmpR family regulator
MRPGTEVPPVPKYLVSTALNACLEIKDGAIIGRRTGDYVHIFGSQEYVSGTHARLQKKMPPTNGKSSIWIRPTALSSTTNGLPPTVPRHSKVETNMFTHISYMTIDEENRLWINASNMLFSYDINDKRFMIWDDSDGFIPNDILTRYVQPSKSNYIYMGGSNGLAKIDKRIVYHDNVPISFILQDIELDGKIYQGSSLSDKVNLMVPQNYSSLKIHIDLNDKYLFRRILFRYRIDNPNNSSIIESYDNVLDLTSLALGQYDLYVSCMTKSGSWTGETHLTSFEVMPPWYKRMWFITTMICFALLTVALTVYVLIRQSKRKLELQMSKHRQELNEDKLQFLTNVSHELRTPLTLIYAPLKRMPSDEVVSQNPEHKQHGSGIGLAYCKELVEKHGGTIGIAGDKSAGAIIYFELPYRTTTKNILSDTLSKDNSTAYATDEMHDEHIDTSPYTIFIVDDNKEFLRYMETELSPLFRKVLKTDDSTDALQILKQYQPDIMVSDVMMPEMDGYKLCMSVKNNIEISHIPVVLLTAKDDDKSRKTGYKLGADAYIGKPFDMELLLSVVGNLLRNKELIKRKYQENILPMTSKQATISNADEHFMTKLNNLIKDNYADYEFTVATIIVKMNMSRASLYGK